MKVTKYSKKDGSTAYMVKGYIGIDLSNGKKRHITKRGFKTPKDAQVYMAKVITNAETYGVTTNGVQSFGDLAKLWIESYKHNVRHSTFNQYNMLLDKHILPTFANIQVKKITPSFCQKVVNEWAKDINHTNTICGVVSHVLQHAVRLNIITRNPMDNVIKPKQKQHKIDEQLEFYTKAELQQLLEYAKTLDTMAYVSIHVLAYTGMRKGELQALRWSDIDFKNSTIAITKTAVNTKGGYLVNPTKTKDSNRTITIDAATLLMLQQWRLEQRKLLFKFGHGFTKDNLVICNVKNNTFVSSMYIGYKLKKLCDQFNFRYLPPHALRHTHCSLMLESGVPIQDVQKRLGHSNIDITLRIYAHISKEQQEKAVEQFSNFMTL